MKTGLTMAARRCGPLPGESTVMVTSPKGRVFRIDLADPDAISVFDMQGRRMLRVNLKGIGAKAMLKRIQENISTGAPAYLAAWPPKDVDRILTCHAIACERYI